MERKLYMRPRASDFRVESDGSVLFMQTKTTTTHVPATADENPYSELRVWGVTESGHSLVLLVRDFKPYFYVKLRDHMNPQWIVRDLNKYLGEEYPKEITGDLFVFHTECVYKKNIMGYVPPEEDTLNLLKIRMSAPRYLAKARDALEDGVVTDGHTCQTFEANIIFTMRFMVDISLSGCQWVSLPTGSFKQLTQGKERSNLRTSLVFLCTDYTQIVPISPKVKGELAPWRWLSYDIEACRYQPGFPKAEEDPITQLCFVLEEEGKGIIWKQAYCLAPAGQSCSEIYGVNLCVYPTNQEPQMLLDVRQFILDCDPDFFTGWNIDKFDNPYTFRDRPRVFQIWKQVSDISRDADKVTLVINKTLTSRAHGTIKSTELVCEGRSGYDGYMHTRLIERTLGLRSYGLNNVAIVVLENDGKVDVPHWQIPILQQGTDADRAHLTHYCMVDAELPLQIMHKRMAMENGAEQARVTGIDFCQMLGGEGKKTFSKLLRVIKDKNVTVPSSAPTENDEETMGGHVFPPKRGYYVKKPVVTCDFASLYPSIIIAYNISFDTICSLAWARANLKPTDYRIPPYIENPTYCFVRSHIHLGVMAELEYDLLAARAEAKVDLKNEKDPKKKAVLDARQLAIKLCANSGYGFFKAHYISNKNCMEAITAWGRYMIELTEKVICEHFTPEHTRYIYQIAPTAMNFVMAYMLNYLNEDATGKTKKPTYAGYSRSDIENVSWWRVAMMIHFKRDIVDEPAELIYGDSVTHDTPCLLLNVETGARFIDTIDNLIHGKWEIRSDGKQVGVVSHDIRVWTEKGWTAIRQIIRHRVNKRIYRVLTHTGVVDVTEDHSLLDTNANKISAVECAVNDTLLLHAYPPFEDKHCRKDLDEYVRCDTQGKLGAATSYYLMRSLGYNVLIDTRQDNPDIYQLTGSLGKPVENAHQIKRITDVTHLYQGGDQYVYDLETENHHFQAGVGQMIVHNTDSVMVAFGEMPNERAWYLGERASFLATCYFERPNELECEAVKQPAIFIKKKGYIVRERLWGSDKGKIKVQGETAKRRDNFLLVANLQRQCAEILMRDASEGGPDVIAAIELVHTTIKKLLMCKVDISELVLSATFSKTLQQYKEGGTKPAHVELWKKKRDRAHITGEYLESTGDRVPYVVMPAPSTKTGVCEVKKWQRVEDPEYCMRNGLYPDPLWYLEQLKKPLIRLLSPVFTGDITEWITPQNRHHPLLEKIFEDIQTTLQGERMHTQEHITAKIGSSKKKLAKMMAYRILFEGAHARVRVFKSVRKEAEQQKKNNTEGKGTLAGFVSKGLRCLKCMNIIHSNQHSISKALCRECLPHHSTIYYDALQKYNHKERLFNAAWTRCQRCQGSLVKEVICGNRDCDNFYRRIALQVDIEDIVEKLNRF